MPVGDPARLAAVPVLVRLDRRERGRSDWLGSAGSGAALDEVAERTDAPLALAEPLRRGERCMEGGEMDEGGMAGRS